MNLSSDELRVLYEGAVKARALREKYEAELLTVLKEQERAYADFHREDVANQGFSKEVERRTSRASGREKEIQKKYADPLNEIEAAVGEKLGPERTALMEQYGTGDRYAAERLLRGPRRPRLDPKVEKLVTELRRLPDEEFKKRADELAERAAKVAGGRLEDARDPEKHMQKIRDALLRIRALEEKDLAQAAPPILKELRVKNRIEQLREELAEMEKRGKPHVGAVGRYIVFEEAVEILARRLGLAAAGEIPTGERK
jgi:hypothetical protein